MSTLLSMSAGFCVEKETISGASFVPASMLSPAVATATGLYCVSCSRFWLTKTLLTPTAAAMPNAIATISATVRMRNPPY